MSAMVTAQRFGSRAANLRRCVSDRFAARGLRCFFLLLLGLALSGCGSYPPAVDSKWDIWRVSSGTTSVGARGMPDEVIPELGRLRDLQRVDFGRGQLAIPRAPITDAGLESLAQLKLPRLDCVCLLYCDGITDRGLESIARMDRLTSLFLGDCPGISDEGLRWIATMERLEYLDLRDSPQITDVGLLYLADAPALSDLNLTGCTGVSDAGVLAIGRQRFLTRMDMIECWGVSDAAVEELRRLNPEALIRGPEHRRMSVKRDGGL